jgi:hypothetical protein
MSIVKIVHHAPLSHKKVIKGLLHKGKTSSQTANQKMKNKNQQLTGYEREIYRYIKVLGGIDSLDSPYFLRAICGNKNVLHNKITLRSLLEKGALIKANGSYKVTI